MQIQNSRSFDPPFIPPRAQRIPPGRSKNFVRAGPFAIKNLLRFSDRNLIAFGPLLASLLAPFSLQKSSYVVLGIRVLVGGFSLKMDIGPLFNPT